MKRLALIAAGALLVADAVVLLGVARNRSGAPEARLVLDERELALKDQLQDNSAIVLNLIWTPGSVPNSLDPAKRAALGLEARSTKPASRPVFAVIALDPGRTINSPHLQTVDAGLSMSALRARYPDRNRYAITPAEITGEAWVQCVARSVYVPPGFFPVFRGLRPTAFPVSDPRYEVTLCFDSAGVPWICGARRLK